jgi:hypothetical protein
VRIRPEVYRALAGIPRAVFRRSLIQFLREHFEDAKTMPAPELESSVDLCLAKAERYGLDTGQDAATFTVTSYLLGLDFDRDFPAATDVLLSPVLTSADKALWLRQWTEELFRTLEARN